MTTNEGIGGKSGNLVW